MKQEKRLSKYLVPIVIAIAIALLIIYFEISAYGMEKALLMRFCSDGFFTSAVLYLGFGLLTFISEAGNFYGLQYLVYTVVHLFSFKKSMEDKKNYFAYCTEKRAGKNKKENSYFKWMLLLIGLVCLIVSAVFAVIYYQMPAVNRKVL